jgi:hypothetical protein
VRVNEAKATAIIFDAEDDLDDSGLFDRSWCRRQADTVGLCRYMFSCRFSLRHLRIELLQKFKGEGLKVHERILLRTSLRTPVQMLSRWLPHTPFRAF